MFFLTFILHQFRYRVMGDADKTKTFRWNRSACFPYNVGCSFW